jgi:hypothetical protein
MYGEYPSGPSGDFFAAREGRGALRVFFGSGGGAERDDEMLENVTHLENPGAQHAGIVAFLISNISEKRPEPSPCSPFLGYIFQQNPTWNATVRQREIGRAKGCGYKKICKTNLLKCLRSLIAACGNISCRSAAPGDEVSTWPGKCLMKSDSRRDRQQEQPNT